MGYELPVDFKYGMYSDGNYLSQDLFKIGQGTWGLFEYHGAITLKTFGEHPIRVESIQDLNDFKSYLISKGGAVNWEDFQNILISLNSLNKHGYSMKSSGFAMVNVKNYINCKEMSDD